MQTYNSKPSQVDNSNINRNRGIAIGVLVGLLLLLIGSIAFMITLNRKQDAEVVSESVSEPVNQVSVSESAPPEYVSSIDTSLSGENMVLGFDSIYTTIGFYGNGKEYVISVTGSVTNLSDVDCDIRGLPDLVINGVEFTPSLEVKNVRVKGSCKYKYTGVFSEVPDTFEVSLGDATGTAKLTPITVPDNLKDDPEGSIAYMDQVSGLYLFKSSERRPSAIIEPLLNQLTYLDTGAVTVANVGGTSSDELYSIYDDNGYTDETGYHFNAVFRNNQYQATSDKVSVMVMFLDANDNIVDFKVITSDKPLGAGETFVLKADVESSDIVSYMFSDVLGL